MDFAAIVTSDPFVQLVDLFPPDRKAALCKRVLDTFATTQPPTGDPVLIHMYAVGL